MVLQTAFYNTVMMMTHDVDEAESMMRTNAPATAMQASGTGRQSRLQPLPSVSEPFPASTVGSKSGLNNNSMRRSDTGFSVRVLFKENVECVAETGIGEVWQVVKCCAQL